MTRDEQGFEGFVDRIENGWVLGWAWDGDRPDSPIEVEVLLDGRLVGRVEAALYRPDLEAAGKGDGRHAFEIELPQGFRDGRPHGIAVRFAGTSRDLSQSPLQALFDVTGGGEQPPECPASGEVGFHSRFGGLWPDRADALEQVELRLQSGRISAAEAALLLSWIENGVVVLPGAVSHEAIDRLEADVDEIWAGRGAARCWVEVFEGDQLMIYPAGPAFRDRRNKLLDLHVQLESARHVAFAPPVQRFLEMIFERPALAFQGLYFRWGSQQAIHQDSAFVKVSSPLELVASWVALEDIQPQSGELEYYVGSHRLDDYLFDGRFKWMPLKSSEYQRFIDSLRERSEAMGLERRRFLPKKGDVLLWSADLAHGGCAEVRPGVTRKSLVTHYCPLDRSPVYGASDRESPRLRHNDGAYCTCAQRV